MQLNHLDQSVYSFINTQFQPAVGYQCFTIFTLAERLGLKNYDETFVSLVAIDEDVDMDEIRDTFIDKVRRLVGELIETHRITIDPDSMATLDELIEIVRFLDLAQNLEDTSVLEVRIFEDTSSPRRIFIDVLCNLSHLEVWRAMEMIKDVDQQLIVAMRQMCEDRQSESPKSSDYTYQQNLTLFADFTNESPSLGLRLLEDGYRNLMWETVEALIPLNLKDHFTEIAKQSVAQAALDFVSMVMLATDTYQNPLQSLQQKISEYLDDRDMVTKVFAAVNMMLVDYTSHKQAALQAQAINQGTER